MLSSPDGATWSTLQNSPGADVMSGDDYILYVARAASYHSAPANDPSSWTELPTPDFPHPDYVLTWGLKYDPDHHVLYSLNALNGFWRMRTE